MEIGACKKHPDISSIGVCAPCLKDRLLKLVCSECGEQRLSFCSCSDASTSSYRNSTSTIDIGSVGRVSFLLENDFPQIGSTINPNFKKEGKDLIFLNRSNSSCCVDDVNKKGRNGFWKIKSLFLSRRKSKHFGQNDVVLEDGDKSEIWGVSRSRSLCSFRGDDGFSSSSAKNSDVTNGILFDTDRGRKSRFIGENLVQRGVFRGRSDFNSLMDDDDDDSNFIDLKLNLSCSLTDSRHDQQFIGGRISGGASTSDHGIGFRRFGSLRRRGKGVFENNGGLNRGSRSRGNKVWKWIFKYHPGSK